MHVKDLYQNLQDFKTFEIDSKYNFDLLASNRMVKIKKPNWSITKIINNKWSYQYFKDVVSFKEVGNDLIILRNTNGLFEVRQSNLDSLLISEMESIKVYESEVNTYFECKNNIGITYLINKNGRIVIEQYDEILYVGNQYIRYKIKEEEFTLHLVADCYF